jgi:hypothetical protein
MDCIDVDECDEVSGADDTTVVNGLLVIVIWGSVGKRF